MSPEQARGKPADKRTDIWSFGCVLYEALSGKVAFVGETVSDTLARILEREPDWEALPEATPAIIRRLLRRCLDKDVHRRFRDAGDVGIEIEEALTEPAGVEISAASGSRQERRSVLLIMMTLLAAIAMAVAVRSLLRLSTSVPGRLTRTTIPLSPGDTLALQSTPAIAMSPDGRHVAYVARHGRSTQLYLRALDQWEARRIDGGEGARMPFFSPDSQWLGFLLGEELKKVSVSGGAPVTIATVGMNVRGASWAPEGAIVLAATNSSGLSRISAAGGERETLTRPNREQGEKTHRFPVVLPGGKAVLFTLGTGDIDSFDEASIAVLSLETGAYRVLVEGGTNARYSATGHLIYARAGSLLAVPFDRVDLRVKGAPVPILQGVMTSPVGGAAQFSVSRDGLLVYARGDSSRVDRRVLWVDREGRAQPLIETTGDFSWPRLSPGGRFLAIARAAANESVWVVDLDRRALTRLTFGFDSSFPIWNPDGRRITFGSTRAGPWNLFWQMADGSSQPEQLAPGKYRQHPSSWSPDGKVLAFEERRPETGRDIWLLSMEGERRPEPFLRTEFNEGDPMLSPDGHWIAYSSDESGRYEVYLRPFPSSQGKWAVSTGGGAWPVWNPNGKELFFRYGDKMMVVDVETKRKLSLSAPRLLFETPFPGYWPSYFDVAADGQRFVMIETGKSQPSPAQLSLVQDWFDELKRLVPSDN